MPTISTLTLYPIKSCAGISLQTAIVSTSGLSHNNVHDREWMLVDSDGLFVTQRSHPLMALIVPHLQASGLIVQAPGMAPLEISTAPLTAGLTPAIAVTIWDDRLDAHDCGDEAGRWFSQVLGQPCRLVRFDPAVKRLASKKWTDDADVPTRFPDGFPILVISQGSLDDLNQKLQAQGRAAVPMNRYRPNIVIDGVDAFEEDFAATIEAGPLRLQLVKPCTRCPMPSVDQATGEFGPDPMDILQTYRSNPRVDGAPTFGVNAILQDGAGEILRVGQEITLELDF
ncbi:MOSC domain-containing protein [Collimonas pratensis]|uniref:MOSC domain-containing protein n=1 Tax=Collimonas pratensis TaxID=279113 RepID=UPI00143E020A|nr:MOSC N-terminal beta barrel domain-containing protein [Collimonas pratensis]NKI71831.1 MOSC domain-containing protein [Collimonas pratensis]